MPAAAPPRHPRESLDGRHVGWFVVGLVLGREPAGREIVDRRLGEGEIARELFERAIGVAFGAQQLELSRQLGDVREIDLDEGR